MQLMIKSESAELLTVIYPREKAETVFLIHGGPGVPMDFSPLIEQQTWPQRLKRMFNIDVLICPKCGGEARVIADTSDRCIEDQQVIDKILSHLK